MHSLKASAEQLQVLAGNRFEAAPLPFELRVLESCLKAVTRLCAGLSKDIESEATPALEALTKQASSPSVSS